jgi:MSV199 domain
MEQLTVAEFIVERGYEIDQMYVDKFWSSISDDKWIYVDSEMLEWIGYSELGMKQRYVQLLKNNFSLGDDYKHLTASDMKKLAQSQVEYVELPVDFNQHNKTRHLIVSPDCFSGSLVLSQAAKAKQVWSQYVTLSKIFREHLKYNIATNEQTLIKLKAGARQTIAKNILLSCEQYIYVDTDADYAKDCIFRIGMTLDIKKYLDDCDARRGLHNRFSLVYVMKCANAKASMHYIFSRLGQFRYSHRRSSNHGLFQIDHRALMPIIYECEHHELQSVEKFNAIVTRYHDSPVPPPIPFEQIAIQDVDQYMENKSKIAT